MPTSISHERNNEAPALEKRPEPLSLASALPSKFVFAKHSVPVAKVDFPLFKFSLPKIRKEAISKSSRKPVQVLSKTSHEQNPERTALLGREKIATKGRQTMLMPEVASEPTTSREVIAAPPELHAQTLNTSKDGSHIMNFSLNLSGLSSTDLSLLITKSKDLMRARSHLSVTAHSLKEKSHRDQILKKRNFILNSQLKEQETSITEISSDLDFCQQELAFKEEKIIALKESLQNSKLETEDLKKQLREERERFAQAKTHAVSHISNLEDVISNLQKSLEGLKSSQVTAKLVNVWVDETQRRATPLSPISGPEPASERLTQSPNAKRNTRSSKSEEESSLFVPQQPPTSVLRQAHVRNSITPSPPPQERNPSNKKSFAVVIPKIKKKRSDASSSLSSPDSTDVYLYRDTPEADDSQDLTLSDAGEDFDEPAEEVQQAPTTKPRTNEEALKIFDDFFELPKKPMACLDGFRLAYKDGTLVSIFVDFRPLSISSLLQLRYPTVDLSPHTNVFYPDRTQEEGFRETGPCSGSAGTLSGS